MKHLQKGIGIGTGRELEEQTLHAQHFVRHQGRRRRCGQGQQVSGFYPCVSPRLCTIEQQLTPVRSILGLCSAAEGWEHRAVTAVAGQVNTALFFPILFDNVAAHAGEFPTIDQWSPQEKPLCRGQCKR